MEEIKNYRAQAKMYKAIELVECFLPLNKWNFKQSAQFFDNEIHPVIIYDSEKCRIRLFYEAPDNAEHSIYIHYGWLGVSNNAQTIGWRDRENLHLYWHSIRFPLQFLDGLSPQEAINEKEPRLIRKFSQSEVAKDIKYEPEKILVMHGKIWETYGQRLFELFDIHNKDLWEQYAEFIGEFWETLSHP